MTNSTIKDNGGVEWTGARFPRRSSGLLISIYKKQKNQMKKSRDWIFNSILLRGLTKKPGNSTGHYFQVQCEHRRCFEQWESCILYTWNVRFILSMRHSSLYRKKRYSVSHRISENSSNLHAKPTNYELIVIIFNEPSFSELSVRHNFQIMLTNPACERTVETRINSLAIRRLLNARGAVYTI